MRFSLRLLLTLLLAGVAVSAIVGASWIYREYRSFCRNMEVYYTSLRVIREIQDYVETHEGAWPRNWDDLEASEIERQNVTVDFQLTPQEIAEKPDCLYTSVIPITWAGRESTYLEILDPRTKFAFDNLRTSVLKYQPAPAETPTASD